MAGKLITTGLVLAITAGTAFPQDKGGARRPGMVLSSPDFQDGGIIPDKFTAVVPNQPSPKLEWSNAPMDTVSFALIVHDPDNAMRRNPEDTLHWLVFNIPGTARALEGGQPATPKLPDGMLQGKNARGTTGYIGPANPAINPYHHYDWELYALDINLPLGPDATRAEVLKAMEGHAIGKAVIQCRFRMPPDK